MLILKIFIIFSISCTHVSPIVTGIFAIRGRFPHQAAILRKGLQHCGGSIIAEKFIITAAHCVYRMKLDDIKVVVGTSDLNKGDGYLFHAQQLIVHPKYDPDTVDYDVALIKLTTPITLGSLWINKIEMVAAGVEYPARTRATISGFGGMNDKSDLSPVLKYSTVELWDRSYCNKLTQGINRVTERMICGGLPSGKVTQCQGDSGGPLIVDEQLYGLASWGFGCGGEHYPGVYTNIGALRQWIQQNSGV